MTEAPQGESPSVAALAIQLSNLRRDLATVTIKAEALARTQQEHAAALADITPLRSEVERILSIVTDDDTGAPRPWFWLTMTDQERDDKTAELHDWVETVLRVQYPGYLADQIWPCWRNHPEARWELTWLYQLWSAAYLSARPDLRDAADWHDRWSPGVIRRLSPVMNRCKVSCVLQSGESGDTLLDHGTRL